VGFILLSVLLNKIIHRSLSKRQEAGRAAADRSVGRAGAGAFMEREHRRLERHLRIRRQGHRLLG
jgi:hypothetical protein